MSVSRSRLRWLATAIGGLILLAIVNALTTGHDVATVPATLAWFALGALVFFGGASLLGRVHLSRTAIAAIVAALLPAVLLSAVVSGLVAPSEVVPTIVIAVLTFVGTFALVFSVFDPGKHGSN